MNNQQIEESKPEKITLIYSSGKMDSFVDFTRQINGLYQRRSQKFSTWSQIGKDDIEENLTLKDVIVRMIFMQKNGFKITEIKA